MNAPNKVLNPNAAGRPGAFCSREIAMSKKLITAAALCLALVIPGAPARAVTIDLFDWALNIDGVFTPSGDPLPGVVDASLFDFATGLGVLDVLLGGTGSHYVSLFLDQEIDETTNTYFNESGSATGTLSAGQSWEIDEPGFVFGDIYDNIANGTLDNTNAVPAGLEDDVSMALAWDFTLSDAEQAVISFLVSATAPSSGFFLTQTDPDSQASLYFSSTLNIEGGSQPVPEPGVLWLMGTGLVGLAALRRRKKEM